MLSFCMFSSFFSNNLNFESFVVVFCLDESFFKGVEEVI